MTQTELNNIITKLKCCSATLANDIYVSLTKGGCDATPMLTLLHSYIEQLQVYKLENTTDNCLDDTQIENIIYQAKSICQLCDCGTH